MKYPHPIKMRFLDQPLFPEYTSIAEIIQAARSRYGKGRVDCPLRCGADFCIIGSSEFGKESTSGVTLWGHLRRFHNMPGPDVADLLRNPERNGVGIPIICSDYGLPLDEEIGG